MSLAGRLCRAIAGTVHLLLLCASAAADRAAPEAMTLPLSTGTELVVERFHAAGDRILWLPSEFGFQGGRERELAEGLRLSGFEVWLADLHRDYFQPTGRDSLTGMPPEEIAELISLSQPANGRLFVMSTGRGGALALLALRLWQQTYPDRRPLGGVFLFHPNLLAKTPKPDRPADYLPVTGLTNQPVFIVQPGDSAKRWYLEEMIGQLETGGSQVFTRLIPGISDGFHVRPDASAEEIAQSRGIPRLLVRAAGMLAPYNSQRRDAPPEVAVEERTTWSGAAFQDGLQPYRGPPFHPPLRLEDLAGRQHDLRDYRGRVVLLNFWTTWCPPCVEEIPSLGRLNSHFERADFTVLAIDIGEEPVQVRRFLERVPAEFPVLLDRTGATVKPWRIRAFPTTFIVDREGRVRYSYFGALEWDTPEVIAIIEALL